MSLLQIEIVSAIRDQIGFPTLALIGASKYTATAAGLFFTVAENEKGITNISVVKIQNGMFEVHFLKGTETIKTKKVHFTDLKETLTRYLAVKTR